MGFEFYWLFQVVFEKPTNIDVWAFWLWKKDDYPNLYKVALSALSVPITSAEVERSFSAYNKIVSDLRTRMGNDTARVQAMLYYNGDVTKT